MSTELGLQNKARDLYLKSSGVKAKSIISNDSQYRALFNETIKLMEKADKLALKKSSKLDSVQKKIIQYSAELIEYEKFRKAYK